MIATMFLFATLAASQDFVDDEGLSLLQLRASNSQLPCAAQGPGAPNNGHCADAGEDGISQWATDYDTDAYRSLTICPEFTPGNLVAAGGLQTSVPCGLSFCTTDLCGTPGKAWRVGRKVHTIKANWTTPRGQNCGGPTALTWQDHAEQCIKQCEAIFPDGVVHCSLGDQDAGLSTTKWGAEGSREGGACPAPGIQYNMPIVGYDVEWNKGFRPNVPEGGQAYCVAKLANPETNGRDGVQKSHVGDPAAEQRQTCMIDPLRNDVAAAAGDPHMESTSGETSDLCCSGGQCKPCA